MKLPELSFWWEWRAGSPFWPHDEAARIRFGPGEIETAELELPSSLMDDLAYAASWHDQALNWKYPPDPGLWRQAECDRFNARSRELFERCRIVLEGRYTLVYKHKDICEDPELDAYLRNPETFRRKA